MHIHLLSTLLLLEPKSTPPFGCCDQNIYYQLDNSLYISSVFYMSYYVYLKSIISNFDHHFQEAELARLVGGVDVYTQTI